MRARTQMRGSLYGSTLIESFQLTGFLVDGSVVQGDEVQDERFSSLPSLLPEADEPGPDCHGHGIFVVVTDSSHTGFCRESSRIVGVSWRCSVGSEDGDWGVCRERTAGSRVVLKYLLCLERSGRSGYQQHSAMYTISMKFTCMSRLRFCTRRSRNKTRVQATLINSQLLQQLYPSQKLSLDRCNMTMLRLQANGCRTCPTRPAP